MLDSCIFGKIRLMWKTALKTMTDIHLKANGGIKDQTQWEECARPTDY